ncbi:hypothetical protein NA57DRAFT_80794 [Rhizodiscina lignyota]|uniref:Uncharacterized protein n=1 Tax=Rhizodiscina lignyota TaxID=1504668 RepID=A0A9P4M1P4_9PEZI|nr:hypothetical protein NA57DRAFT_80794 [Rhizodiscina lignyota]
MLLAAILTFGTLASAEIIFLASCSAAQNGNFFGLSAAVYYANNPSGEVNPDPDNIGVRGSDNSIWFNDPEGWTIFPATREAFVLNGLDQSVTNVGGVAGSGINGQKHYTCMRDTGGALFNNGFLSCNKEFYCQPVRKQRPFGSAPLAVQRAATNEILVVNTSRVLSGNHQPWKGDAIGRKRHMELKSMRV